MLHVNVVSRQWIMTHMFLPLSGNSQLSNIPSERPLRGKPNKNITALLRLIPVDTIELLLIATRVQPGTAVNTYL